MTEHARVSVRVASRIRRAEQERPPNPYLINTLRYAVRYMRMHAKPMEVIHHLYYRMCVRQLPSDYTHKQLYDMRSWTGGPKARVPQQEVSYIDPPPDPPLKLQHVLEVLEWLFTEVPVDREPNEAPSDTSHLSERDKPQYFNRLQYVNAQAVAAGFRNTKHRPYDMLAAIFLCADFMLGTDEQKHELTGYKHTFMQMYLEQSTHFDYMDKDVYAHNYNRAQRVSD